MDIYTSHVAHRDDVRCYRLLLECLAAELLFQRRSLHQDCAARGSGNDLYGYCRPRVGASDRKGFSEGRRYGDLVRSITAAGNGSADNWNLNDCVWYPRTWARAG